MSTWIAYAVAGVIAGVGVGMVVWALARMRKAKADRDFLRLSLAIVVTVLIIDLVWLDRTSLTWIIFGFMLAVGLFVVYLLRRKPAIRLKPSYVLLAVIGVSVVAMVMDYFAPTLSASEVEALLRSKYNIEAYRIFADYKWNRTWEVKVAGKGDWVWFIMDDRTGKVIDAWKD